MKLSVAIKALTTIGLAQALVPDDRSTTQASPSQQIGNNTAHNNGDGPANSFVTLSNPNEFDWLALLPGSSSDFRTVRAVAWNPKAIKRISLDTTWDITVDWKRWGFYKHDVIVEGIAYLREQEGLAHLRPDGHSRVSCSYKSGISWWNLDEKKPKEVKWKEIIEASERILSTCIYINTRTQCPGAEILNTTGNWKVVVHDANC